jgi:hypothetical protein
VPLPEGQVCRMATLTSKSGNHVRLASAARIGCLLALLVVAFPAMPRAQEEFLCGSVSGTLSASLSPYRVRCIHGEDGIQVRAGSNLIIEPGVELWFDAGMSLAVHGSLTALGTIEAPIVLTSSSIAPASGDWAGIDVDGSIDMQFSAVRYAISGIDFTGTGGGSVTDSEFSSALSSALSIWSDNWPTLRRLSASGSPFNGTVVRASSLTSGTWTAAGIPYVLEDPLGLSIQSLTIEPGTVVKLLNFAELDIQGGGLTAEGTAAQPIIFTSLLDDTVGGDTNGDGSLRAPSPGDWRWIDLSPGATNRLRHLDVRYAATGISIGSGSTTLHDSSFSNLSGAPVELRVDAYPDLAGLTAVECAVNGIQPVNGMYWGNVDRGTWPDAGIPYVFLSDFLFGDLGGPGGIVGGITLAPGVVMKLGNVARFGMWGTLIADGTPEKPVVFTSIRDDTVAGDTNGDGSATSPSTGDWGAIHLFDHNSGAHSFRNTQIRYANIGLYTGLGYPTDFQVSDSTISLTGTGAVCDDDCSIHNTDFVRNSVGLVADHRATVTGSRFVGNGTAARAETDNHLLDLGTLGDPSTDNDGDNAFVCNNVDVDNWSSTPISAEANWWGETPPDLGEILGLVDIDPYVPDGSNALIPDLSVALTTSPDAVVLQWGDSAPNCGYRILRSTSPDGGFIDLIGVTTNTQYHDPEPISSPETFYYYIEID